MRNDQQIQAMQLGDAAAKVEALVRDYLEELERSVDNKIYSTLGHSLDPLEAVRLVTEKATYGRLRKKFKMDRVKGHIASESLHSTMEKTHAG